MDQSKTTIPIEEAEQLLRDVAQKLGYNSDHASNISHHLIDTELRGFRVAGLARMLSIADRIAGKPPAQEYRVVKDGPATAQIDGQDTLGYIVAHAATRLVIEKAKKIGVAVVGAHGTYYTGMLSYYAEMAAAEDLVTIIASNTTPWVAPEGTYRPLVGTNPFAIGFPTEGVPIIYDIGTSKIIHAEAMLARRLGQKIPEDSAFNTDGEPTTDPQEALDGALAVWGGAKGSGLAMAVQLLGVLAGSPALPPEMTDFGFFIVAIDPKMFRPVDEYKEQVETMKRAVSEAPSAAGSKGSVRMPFQRSHRQREERRAEGVVEVDSEVLVRLRQIAAGSQSRL
ncbi:hypothetical protein M409DRAFT_30837 [Zasmidium cellare ATCC 36951]|uniref:Uncharacterized protein n=1 Tax=Zasmidium cellare ATCC 36951 TaxID=1080233 RepID=A0A6A6BV48_ZASCE|nr:uncharacterized protein M409DRAFT_30837 [Zasmidium cellare ATCC 36951]KAF2158674.1 hypothetical protein M409DRAFT_30837 [Zasmidium cellare ATCC 36951]